MKHLLLAGAIALASSLGGCTEFDAAINGAVGFIDAPKTQQALSSLKSGATALHMRRRRCFLCFLKSSRAPVRTGDGGLF